MRYLHLEIAAPMIVVAASLGAQQAPSRTKHAFTPGDWYKVTTVGTPALSPDGGKVAFTVTTVREARIGGTPKCGSCRRRVSDAGALHVAGVREQSALLRRRQDSLLHVAAARAAAARSGRSAWMSRRARRTSRPASRRSRRGSSAGRQELHGLLRRRRRRRGGRGGGRGGAAPDSTPSDTAIANDPFGRDGADLASAVQRDHEAGESGALRRTADRRHDVQGERPGAVHSRSAHGAAPRHHARRADLPRSAPARRAQGDHEHEVLASRRGRVARRQVDRVSRRRAAALRLGRERGARFGRQAAARPQARRAPRNDTEIFVIPVAACEAHSAECTPRKIDYAGNETQFVWSPDSKQIAFVGQLGAIQESAAVRRRRRRRQAAGPPRRVAVRARADRVAQERSDRDGDVDRRQPRRLQHRSGDEEDHDGARRPSPREHAGRTMRRSRTSSSSRPTSRIRRSCSSPTPTARASESSRRSTTS